MASPMRANSPIDDPAPYQPPVVKPVPKPPRPKKTEWQKFVAGKKFPEVAAYIATRKEYWRMYLPDGSRIQDIAPEHRAAWWACAAQIISEYEDFQQILVEKAGMTKL